ncbi:MAG: hypothetical protein FWH18_02005 [Marinilabiliaceae bacterium]|nr:hypothetical protein [Marinilabiliaceae bacterium]
MEKKSNLKNGEPTSLEEQKKQIIEKFKEDLYEVMKQNDIEAERRLKERNRINNNNKLINSVL